VTPQTMFDVARQAAVGPLLRLPTKPSFTQEILPLFRQFHEAQWVNKGFFIQFGWMGPNDFMRPDVLKKLATPPFDGKDPFAEMRRQIFYSFRDPSSNTFEPLKWPPLYGDAFGSFDAPPGPRVGFAVTSTIYQYLSQWMEGNFIGDFDPKAVDPSSIADVTLEDQPTTLDRAALHFCMGGPFHPGCEMTWPMRRTSMYRSPFRLRERPASHAEPDYGEFLTQETILADDGPLSASGPGDISKWMAVPWQTDTASCRAGYPQTEFPDDTLIPTFWPSRVPNTVLSEENYKKVINTSKPLDERIAAFYERDIWYQSLGPTLPNVDQITHMVNHFGEMPVIEKRETHADPNFPAVMYVATVPASATMAKATTAFAAREIEPEGSGVTVEFARARFGGLRRLKRS